VLDAGNGPIVVERDALIEPHSFIAGPCWIGAGTHVLGGKLGGGVSLGPVCRVAGEVEESIFQGFANKRHHGFVGHSIVGAWANLGALTTTSDLKNNYGPVRVSIGGKVHDTGESKVGAFLGDHVKTAIGTLLTTGAVAGRRRTWSAARPRAPRSCPRSPGGTARPSCPTTSRSSSPRRGSSARGAAGRRRRAGGAVSAAG